MNAYRWFARYMNDEYKPIPSSIIAEGDAVWQGAKDRGDMAMIAYGASRYALTYGNADSAKVLWPLIEWCLEYLKRKVDQNGVVASNSDELEGRFPAGKANLNTSILYYDALRSAAMLGKLVSIPKAQTDRYANEAKEMRSNIEKFFGASVEGFKTYRYYEGNDTLRAWICSPLTVGIFERKEGTIAALFSPRLWTEDGLASLAGNTTFWDRSTLYALRGVLAAGETEKAMQFLRYYSQRRLLGEHVPYPVEAYPEGNQRHLSAESGLYCRIYTEGLFGMRPVSFNGFECTPRLPNGWNQMALKNVHAFGNVFDITVNRVGADKLGIIIHNGQKEKKYVIKEGATQLVQL
jgi:GH15 family glucan-1,4-alpha-glucosidase